MTTAEHLRKIELTQETGRENVTRRITTFPWRYMQKDPSRVIDSRLANLFREMQYGNYWMVLRLIDGSSNHPIQPTSQKETEEARAWAKNKFDKDELSDLLQICVDTALTIPFKKGTPATYKGHSVLYRELVDKPSSLFGDVVTEATRKRLNNGRFWEELPDMTAFLNFGKSYRIVGDVLANHSQDLDVAFTPQGYEIFKRNHGETDVFDLRGLSAKAIEAYAKFVGQINEKRDQLKLSPLQISYLVRPYVISLLEPYNPEAEYPRPRTDYVKKLKEPLIKEYVATSDLVRTAVAEKLELEINYGDWMHALKVIQHIENPEEMFNRIRKMLSQRELSELKSKCEKINFPLSL